MSDPDLDEVIAKTAIRDVLSRYCRGLDRMDKEMAYATWHEDGTALYVDMYDGTGRGFVDWVWKAHEPMECHSHQITNCLVEVAGDTATSESYVTVVLWMHPEARENAPRSWRVAATWIAGRAATDAGPSIIGRTWPTPRRSPCSPSSNKRHRRAAATSPTSRSS